MITTRALTAVLAYLSSIAVAHPQAKPYVKNRDSNELVQPIYQALPLGSISPQGWLKDQLEQSAAGLAGNLFDFYRFVKDSEWLGGHSEYSTLHESAPYWFNGLVPLAFGLDDDTLKGQVKTFLDYILDHQQDDGWLGPETTSQTRGLWGRCYVLLGLMQYAQADASETERIVDALHRYIELVHSMLKDDFAGLIPKSADDVFDGGGWGPARAHEMHIPLQWLYENYPKNNSELIWETMDLMIEGSTKFGVDWRSFFVEGVFPEVVYAPEQQTLFTHGVNLAEGIRFPLAVYRTSHDESLRTQTRTAVDLVAKYHKSLAGTIIGDEHITDLNPSRGAELCTSAELMFSLAWIYQYLGDNDIADWVELAAFNAFPGQIWSDWWSHQYVQQENQPWSRNLTEQPQMWQDVGSYGNVFGLEPNYPCCTVNHPQGYPKFLANSFVGTEDGGIAHVFLSPGSVSTTLNNKDKDKDNDKDGNHVNKVTIEADTDYPFAMTVNYTISCDEAFSFYVRIPGWVTSGSTATGPSDADGALPIVADGSTGLQRFSIPGGRSRVSVALRTEPRVVERANDTVGVYYGPILYSLALEVNETTRAAVAFDQGYLDPASTTAQTRDHVVEAVGVWNLGIDTEQIKVVTASSPSSASSEGEEEGGGEEEEEEEKEREKLKNPIWELGAPPVELRIAAAEIEWPVMWDSPVDGPVDVRVKGEAFGARFVPFGSAKVHMAHFPRVKLEGVEL